MRKITLLLSLLVIFYSCTIQKRVHKKGFYIEWNKNIKANDNQAEVVLLEQAKKHESNQTENYQELENLDLASTTPDYEFLTQKLQSPIKINAEKKKSKREQQCDLIIFRNGQEVEAIVLEVGTSETKYKECANPNGPIFIKKNSEIFMIKYPNGSSTLMDNLPKQEQEDKKPKNDITKTLTSGKSFVVTALLWFFLGFFGIHRFYLGHYGIGILYLLTGALCGIGWIIDLVLLLTGNLKPRDGDFEDDF